LEIEDTFKNKDLYVAVGTGLLTWDNMIKRKWKGDDSYYFCCQAKTVQHLFFLCPIAKEVWGFIAIHIGADCIPSSALQYYEWVDKFLLLNTCTPCVLSTLLGHLEGA
jgi:hypothetical protein